MTPKVRRVYGKEVDIGLLDYHIAIPIGPKVMPLVFEAMSGERLPDIHVVEGKAGRFTIINGMHYWLAHKLAGNQRVNIKYAENIE